jgi:Rieske Fe-S protein
VHPSETERALSRRQVLLTGGTVVAAVAVTTACSSPASTAPPSATTSTSPATTTPPPAGPSAVGTSTAPATPSGTVVAASTIPVGGGIVLDSRPVVVTQPQAGVFKAFSAVCTHQGCTVAGVSGGVIVCPCHQSTFSITDGSVQGGPAPSALPSVGVTVSGTNVVVAS